MLINILKALEGGYYKYSTKNKCYLYVSKNGDGSFPTGIGYGRVLYAGDKVSKTEKENVINQLKNWDRRYSLNIERGNYDKQWASNFNKNRALDRTPNSNSNPNYDYHDVHGKSVDMNNVNNSGFVAKQKVDLISQFKINNKQ